MKPFISEKSSTSSTASWPAGVGGSETKVVRFFWEVVLRHLGV